MGTANNLESFSFGPAAVFDPARFELCDLGIALEPSFRIGRAERILVMGSCFAVRVAQALRALGLDASDGGLQLKYNAFSMLQELRWCLSGGFGAAHVLFTPEGRWVNPHRHPARLRATRAEVLDAHLAAQRSARELLRTADVFVLTYGLIEAWFDRVCGLYTNEAPPIAANHDWSKRFELRQTTHAQNLEAMLALVHLVREANPRARFVASVSPVPLKATFCGPDVLVSNCASKSTLRSALHEAIPLLREEGVPIDYFPSYEIVTLAPRRDEAWRAQFPDGAPDGRHVRDDFVEHGIMQLFLRSYLEPDTRLDAQPALLPAAAETLGTLP
ncbi:MAG: GSCFA domain-containing protein [Planctomycetes bacterium]|nr:GSCFA domain-containing protein [Planctomycetota bacterium]